MGGRCNRVQRVFGHAKRSGLHVSQYPVKTDDGRGCATRSHHPDAVSIERPMKVRSAENRSNRDSFLKTLIRVTIAT